MSFYVNLNPLDDSVLFYGNQHRACYVYSATSNDSPIYVRRGDQKLWQHLREHNLDERVKFILDSAGFGGFIDVGYHTVDHALIHAMVERWHPETHTFHLPFGEATITLQDVNVLWGLPIEGAPVTGIDTSFNKSQHIERCTELLGFIPQDGDINGGRIKSTVLTAQLSHPLPDDATPFQCIQRARVIGLILCGGTLFPCSTNDRISLHYLHHLVDLSGATRISWGSAVLACLYRNLCKSCQPNTVEISGPVYLLQLWVWERFNNLAPRIKNDRFNYNVPLGARWRVDITNVDNTSHMLRGYHSQLQSMNEGHFNWTPYARQLGRLPPICVSGHRSWMCEYWLILWEVAEVYLPGRVLRQFNIVQGVPPPVPVTQQEHYNVHSITRTERRSSTNWSSKRARFVTSWNERHQHTVGGEIITGHTVTDNYMFWYNSITIPYISNPTTVHSNPYGFQDDGGVNRLLVDGFVHAYNESQKFIGSYPEQATQFTQIGNTLRETLHPANQEHWLGYSTHLTTEPVELVSNDFAPQMAGRRGRRRGNGRRHLQDDENQEDIDLNRQTNIHEPGPSSLPLTLSSLEPYVGSRSHDGMSPNFDVGGTSGVMSSGYVPSYNQSPASYNEFGVSRREDERFTTPPPFNSQDYDFLDSFGFNFFKVDPSANEPNRFSNVTPIQMNSFGRPEQNIHPRDSGTGHHLDWRHQHQDPPQ